MRRCKVACVVQFDRSCESVEQALASGGVVAKVTDFGLSKHIHWGGRQGGMRDSTPCIVAPEASHSQHLHPLSNVFAFGVIMWELMQGCPVFVRCAGAL
jgi:serine/threonine protein kinase